MKKWLDSAAERLHEINERTQAEKQKLTKEEKAKKKSENISLIIIYAISFVPTLIITALIATPFLLLIGRFFKPSDVAAQFIAFALFGLFITIWQGVYNFIEKKMRKKEK